MKHNEHTNCWCLSTIRVEWKLNFHATELQFRSLMPGSLVGLPLPQCTCSHVTPTMQLGQRGAHSLSLEKWSCHGSWPRENGDPNFNFHEAVQHKRKWSLMLNELKREQFRQMNKPNSPKSGWTICQNILFLFFWLKNNFFCKTEIFLHKFWFYGKMLFPSKNHFVERFPASSTCILNFPFLRLF